MTITLTEGDLSQIERKRLFSHLPSHFINGKANRMGISNFN